MSIRQHRPGGSASVALSLALTGAYSLNCRTAQSAEGKPPVIALNVIRGNESIYLLLRSIVSPGIAAMCDVQRLTCMLRLTIH